MDGNVRHDMRNFFTLKILQIHGLPPEINMTLI